MDLRRGYDIANGYVLDAACYPYKERDMGREMGNGSLSFDSCTGVPCANLHDPDRPLAFIAKEGADLVDSALRMDLFMETNQMLTYGSVLDR
jgi:hypothetical protein